jgi:hypothetical protein
MLFDEWLLKNKNINLKTFTLRHDVEQAQIIEEYNERKY